MSLSPVTFLWDGSNRPSLGGMTATTRFDDVAVDDATTGESATVTDSVGAACAKKAVTSYLTAVADFGQLVDLSGQAWRATGRGHNSTPDLISNCGLFPDDPNTPRPATQTLYLEVSPDGSSWTSVTSGAFSQTSSTLTGTFGPGITARYVRAVVESFREVYAQRIGAGQDQFGTVSELTDLRLTAESLPGPCTPPDAPIILSATPGFTGAGVPNIVLVGR